MRKKILVVLGCFIVVFLCFGLVRNHENKDETVNYKRYIDEIYIGSNYDIDESLRKTESEIANFLGTDEELGLAMLARQHFYSLKSEYKKVNQNAEVVEQLLIKGDCSEALLYHYLLQAYAEMSIGNYIKSYVSLYKGEYLAKDAYARDPNEKNLRTLMALQYLKAVNALYTGLKQEAKQTFAEAESLRQNNELDEFKDIWSHVTRYYYYLEDYEQAIKYANYTLDLTKGNIFKDEARISLSIMLAKSYLKLGDSESSTFIMMQLKAIEESIQMNLLKSELYELYAMNSQYEGDEASYIDYLEQAYSLLESEDYKIKKYEIVNTLLHYFEETNHEEKIIYWSKVYHVLVNELLKSRDTQYLLREINENSSQYADKLLENLELEEANTFYLIVILLLTLTAGSFVVRHLIYKNYHDLLTKTYNRGAFNKRYERLKSRSKKFSIIIFDIDNFKKINDKYGHPFGDKVLIEVCKETLPLLHHSDRLYRYGGEEFVVIVEKQTKEYVLLLAEKIRKRIEQLTWEEAVTVTISSGVAYSDYIGSDILKIADQHLYVSKQRGKNRVTS